MQSTNQSYKLHSIVMMESNFKREAEIPHNHVDFKNKIGLKIDVMPKSGTKEFAVGLSVEYAAGVDSTNSVLINVTMLGNFEFTTASTTEVQQFGRINAAAIIYPFIREHIANLSAKAGMDMILLPTFNFVQLAETNE
jgi:preprotein translocase subunit SecB